MSRVFMTVIFSFVFGFATRASANWTLNVGYQNPAGSLVGLNFLNYMTSNWAFEFGVSGVQVRGSSNPNGDEDNDGVKNKDDSDYKEASKTKMNFGGDLDLKYLFGSSSIRPYIQGGVGLGAGGSVGGDSYFGGGTGSGFFGGGFFLGAPSLYGYASYNIGGYSNGFIQAGVGLDI